MADFAAVQSSPSGGGARVVHQEPNLTITASGSTQDFSVSGHETLWVSAFATAISGTGSPTVTFYVEQQDANDHWIITTQIGVAISSAPNYTAGFAGRAPGGILAGRARITWSVTGTNPSFTVDLSVIGR